MFCGKEDPICPNCCTNICCRQLFGPLQDPAQEKCPKPCIECVPKCPQSPQCTLKPLPNENKLWHSEQILPLNQPMKWRCPPEKIKHKKIIETSLGNPVGVSFGSFTIRHPNYKPIPAFYSIQAYATCLMAFGEIYITPEEEWDNCVLNRILDGGKQHVIKSVEAVKDRLRKEQAEKADKAVKESDKQVTDDVKVERLTEKDINKTFIICANRMTVEIFDPFVIGTIVSTDPKIPSLLYGIEKFMRKYRYCLLTVATQHYLIWKSMTMLFVYDCYGRNENLIKRTLNGYSALISVCAPKNVYHLFINMSNLDSKEPFVIRKIKLVDIYPCCRKMEIGDAARQREFEIVDDNHAVLKGHMHLATACFQENRNKFSLAVAVVAILTTKIDQPATWDCFCVDKVLIIARKFHNIWTNCKHHLELQIRNIPSDIEIGKFIISISISQVEACGTWIGIANFKRSEITSAIKKIFEKSPNLIVQVANRSYAMMKRGNFFYLFDPYRHDTCGAKQNMPFANLHMFSTINMLCCVFSNEIIDLISPAPFYIHNVRIKYIRNKADNTMKQCRCAEFHNEEEVLSLNDSLGDVTCKDELICVAEKYGFEPDGGNLDSPGLSQTQITPNYDDLKASDDEDHPHDDDDDLDDDDDEGDRGEADDDDDDKKKKKRKGKPPKEDKAKAAKEKEKEEKERLKKEKEAKEKEEREKERLEKERLAKEQRDKERKERDKKAREEKEKERKEKEALDKDAKAKADKEKADKAKTKKDKKAGKKGDDDKKDGDKKDGDKKDGDKKDGDKKGGDKKGGAKKAGGDKDKASDESDEESGSEEEEDEKKPVLDGCIPNSYPGYSSIPQNLAVAGSETGDYESLCNLLKTGFKCSDRILTMTPWGNYVVFKSNAAYLLFDGCTCNVDRFRHLDLSIGTAGLLCFGTMHELLERIIQGKGGKSQKRLENEKKYLERVVDDLCEKYG